MFQDFICFKVILCVKGTKIFEIFFWEIWFHTVCCCWCRFSNVLIFLHGNFMINNWYCYDSENCFNLLYFELWLVHNYKLPLAIRRLVTCISPWNFFFLLFPFLSLIHNSSLVASQLNTKQNFLKVQQFTAHQ